MTGTIVKPRNTGKGIEEARAGQSRWLWIALFVITLGAVLLRWRYLDVPMRYDESFTVWRYAAQDRRVFLRSYSLPNNHVFHSLLVHIAIRLGDWRHGLSGCPRSSPAWRWFRSRSWCFAAYEVRRWAS